MVSEVLDTDMIAMTTGVASVAAVYSVPVRSIVLVRIDSAAATATQGCPPQSRLGGVPDAEAGGALPRRRDLRRARQREAATRISHSGVSSFLFPSSSTVGRTHTDKHSSAPKRATCRDTAPLPLNRCGTPTPRNELATVGGPPRRPLLHHRASLGPAFGHDCPHLASAGDRLPSAKRVPGNQARGAPATLSIGLHHHRNGPRSPWLAIRPSRRGARPGWPGDVLTSSLRQRICTSAMMPGQATSACPARSG